MPDDKPTPITPEGKRAADRIRSIFFMIAAANIVIVAIVIWQRQTGKKPRDPGPTKPAAVENAVPASHDVAPDGTKRHGDAPSAR